eukprot:SAG11_NODE_4640_length_1825_cov_0.957706_3_plen_74_part_00
MAGIDDEENALRRRNDKLRDELLRQDREQIKRSITFLDDVTSAVWTMPILGIFAAVRLLMLVRPRHMAGSVSG